MLKKLKTYMLCLLAALCAASSLGGCADGSDGLTPADFFGDNDESDTSVTTTYPTETTAAATTEVTTTAKTASTTAEPELPEVNNKLKYYTYIALDDDEKMSDVFIKKTADSDLFKPADTMSWYFYGFRQELVSGIGVNGQLINHTGYANISAEIKNNRQLTVSTTTSAFNVEAKDITIRYELDSEAPVYQMQKDDSALTATADLYDASYNNGFYELKADFDINGNTNSVYLYLYVNCASNDPSDYEFYICFGDMYDLSIDFNPIDRRDMIQNLLDSEGVTPQKAVSRPNARYPEYNDSDDRKYWIDLSHEILMGNEDKDPTYKALLLHDWLTSHMKYDYYKSDVLIYPRYYDPETKTIDPSQYLSKNFTGVCLDFSCIYALMCREHDIPCVVLSNDTHAWNVIYIEQLDQWLEVDLTIDTNRLVYGADVNDVTGDQLYCYDGFFTPIANSEIPKFSTAFCW